MITGVGSVAIYIGMMWVILHYQPASVLLATVLSYSLATLASYLGNYYWSFRSRSSHYDATWKFAAVVVVGILSNAIFVTVLHKAGVTAVISGLIFSGLWPVVSFPLQKLWTFRS